MAIQQIAFDGRRSALSPLSPIVGGVYSTNRELKQQRENLDLPPLSRSCLFPDCLGDDGLGVIKSQILD